MKAKELRAVAGYRNQSATPGVIPFPGVARFYRHPVMSRRPAVRTSYTRLPLMLGVTKVETKLMSLVVDRKGNGIPMVEMRPRLEPVLDEHGAPKLKPDGSPEMTVVLGKNGQPLTDMHTKEEMVPVPKPARLDPKCPKGVYRVLKKLARKGQLEDLGRAYITAEQAKGATA